MDRQQGLAEQIDDGFRCFWVVLVCLGGPKHSFLASVSLYGLYSVYGNLCIFEAFLGHIRLTCRGSNVFRMANSTNWEYVGAGRIQKFEFSNGYIAV